jgi:L,D-peptidoglycan transpeptidase YkuD (ErfK/YbiS/YcfS/YnhG family)
MNGRPQHGPRGWTALVGAAVLAAVGLAPAGPAAAAAAPVATGPLDPALFDAQLTRAPYLTDLVDQHVAVNFATVRALDTASVKYGPVDSDGTCDPSTTADPRRHGITVGSVDENQWTAEIDVPSTGSYCYRVYAGGIDLLGANASPIFTTQVQPGGTESFSFDVMGDWGQVDANGDNPDMANLMQQIAASRARFMVTVGDNGYPAGSQTNYGDLQQKAKDTSAIFGPKFWTVPSSAMPIFTVPGNHGLGTGISHTDLTTWTQDRVVATSGGRYQNDVYCCVNGTAQENYASEWYAFTAGNARFYMLDAAWGNSNLGSGTMYSDDYAAHWAPGSPEREWLAADLAAHPTQLKFAFFHYPLYVDNPTESSDTYLQGANSLEGLLADNGVQMVFNGHAHLYERNSPSAPGMPVSYVTGGGGGTLEPISRCSPIDAYGIGWSPSSASGSACGTAPRPTSAAQVFHFLKVTVSGGSVTVAPTNSLGQTFDVHSYQFTPGTPPPPETSLDSGPDALTKDTSATFTFHASDPSATFRCTLDGAAPEPCTSPTTYSRLADGDHTFAVAASAGGSTDATPATQSWSVDTTPPSVPTGLSADPSTTQIALSWSPSSGGAVGYHVYRDGALLGTTDTTGYTDTKVSQGTSYRYQVTALDGLGNESAPSDATVTGLEPPPETTLDSGPDAPTKDTSATFAFHASDPSATFSCTLDGGSPEPCTSPTTYSGLADGTHTFTVAAAIGGIPDPTPATRDWTVDTTAPSVPTGLSADPSTTEIALSWSPSSGGVVGYHVYRDGVLLGTTVTTGYTDTKVSRGTSYSYQVTALDALGNESARSDPQAAELDDTPAVARRIRLGGVSVRLPAGSRQVVTVNHTRRYHARVTLWQERQGHWHRVARAHDGRTGSGGLVAARRLRQGSHATPLGTLGLVSAFGRHHRHHAWQLPYRRVRAGDYWVGDNRSAYYNRYRNKADGGFRWWLPPSRVNASQRLSGHQRQFEMTVVTDFNQDQVRHRGAGIFLQVNAHGGTTGSVSAPRWFLAKALAVLDPAERPVIAVGR